ncbi:MAG: hypothetical protein KDJ16_02835 [Hyphomicrobiales bacterium]|nr:hypothetical protein [Hyphomicrobiales bacterium]
MPGRRILLPLVALFLGCVLPATAAATEAIPRSDMRYGNWEGSAYADETRFSHCALSASYKSGISVHFAIDRDYLWRIGFSHEQWQLEPGATYNVRYRIDGYSSITAEAKVINDTFMMAELAAKERIFNQFRRGNTLNIQIGDTNYAFSLKGTSRALSGLLRCVDRYIDYRTPGRVARAPVPEPDPEPAEEAADNDIKPPSPQDMLAATRFIVNLFAASELSSYELLDQAKMADPSLPNFIRTAAVGWTTSSTIGMLHVFDGDSYSGSEILAELFAIDARGCPGSFASGSKKSTINSAVLSGFTACKHEGAYKFYTDYLTFPQSGNKLYLISNMQFDQTEVDQSVSETLARNVALSIK